MPDTATPVAPAAQSDPYDIEAAFPEAPAAAAKPAPAAPAAPAATPEVAAAPPTNFPKPAAPPEPPETPAAEPARTKHSPAVLELAQRFGFTAKQIHETSPDQLREDVRLVHSMIVAEQKRNEVADAVHAPGSKPTAASSAAAATPTAEPDLDLGFKEEDYDPSFVTALKSALKPLVERNKKLEARLDAYESRDTHRTVNSTAELLDSIFDAMPGREAHYGKGPAAGLAKDSGEYKRRLRLLAAAGVDLKNPPSAGKLRQMLHDEDEVFYGARATAAAPDVDDDPAPRRTIQNRDPATGRILPSTNGNGHGDANPYATPTARPTQRTTELPPGDEKAKQLLKDLFASRGEPLPGASSEGPDDFLSDFPK